MDISEDPDSPYFRSPLEKKNVAHQNQTQLGQTPYGDRAIKHAWTRFLYSSIRASQSCAWDVSAAYKQQVTS